MFPLLTVECDEGSARLEVAVSYVEDVEGLHDPAKGRYDFNKLVHWEEIPGTSGPDYTSSAETFRRECSLKGEKFTVEIIGEVFGTPMSQCGLAISATVQIWRREQPFFPKTVLDDCFERGMPPIRSIVVDMKTRRFQVHRERFIGG